MTDYIRDLTSPHKWVRESAERCATDLRVDTTITDGVIRWNSNNQVPPEECVALAVHIGLPVNVARCDKARNEDFAQFMVEYRAAQARRTPEEIAEQRAEARAAHGPGVELVNLLTRERFRT